MFGWRHVRSVLRHIRYQLEQDQLTHTIPFCTEMKSSSCLRLQPFLSWIIFLMFIRHFHKGQFLGSHRTYNLSSGYRPSLLHQYLQRSGISYSKNLLAEADANLTPISSPLTPILGPGLSSGKTEKSLASKPSRVQAVKKGIRQSPKKVNLVAKLVRGMRVEDALLQLQVTVKRAAKTVYQVIHSARANAAHNHGLDPDRLIVAEAFVGKGLFLKRVSYHAKGRSGIMVRPHCRVTVVVREITPEEEAKIAKLRVSNFKRLSKRERQLVPHQLIETTPRWSRKRREHSPQPNSTA